VPTPALEAELRSVVSGPVTREMPAVKASARGGGWLRRIAATVLLSALASAAYTLWDRATPDDPPQPAAPPGGDVWVQIRVRVEADRTRQGGPWDVDGSGPELRVTVSPRDESVVLGPCENNRVCEGAINAARLVTNVPFRVTVDEMDLALPDRVGAGWLWWRGGREETLHARLGAVDVTVVVKRLAFQPLAPVTPPSGAGPMDAGTRPRAVDAGAPTKRSSVRARPRPRPRPTKVPAGAMVPLDDAPDETPLAPVSPF